MVAQVFFLAPGIRVISKTPGILEEMDKLPRLPGSDQAGVGGQVVL
ncbi:hypothetical protein ACFLWH_02040 [Chloroflexota bacterium]